MSQYNQGDVVVVSGVRGEIALVLKGEDDGWGHVGRTAYRVRVYNSAGPDTFTTAWEDDLGVLVEVSRVRTTAIGDASANGANGGTRCGG